MIRKIAGMVSSVGIALLVAVRLLAQPAPATPSMPRERALLIVRTINTAQTEMLKTEKQYVALPKLVQHAVFAMPELQSLRQGTIVAPDGGPIPVGSYALRVDPSASGRRYTVSLVGEMRCSTSWFSNETGLIYEGKAIGCEEK